jgi:diguanylate cyclase (GGDEF)-like protein/PAS domain S-box-containing protein
MTWLGKRAVPIATLIFAVIFALHVLVGTAGAGISFLYVVPVVVVGVALGTRAGLVAGAVAFVVSSLGSILADLPLSAVGYVNRALVYLFIGGLVGSFADRLRTLEAESARHFNLSRDMICIAGFDGYFKRVNPAFERILGFAEEELLDKPFIDFVHPDDRERTEEEAAAIGAGRGAVQFRNRYFDKSGRVHWIEWASVAVTEKEEIYAVARDVTDRKAIEDELQLLSQRDPLTGLLNRRSFDEALEREIARARRHGSGGAVLLVDLDRFKQINDEFGHGVGDEALCHVAETLATNLREGDTLGRDPAGIASRLGGDEFALLLPEAGAAGAETVAERLVAALSASPLHVDGQAVPIGISVGAAVFEGASSPAAKELLASADRAMYVAKAAGGCGAVLAEAAG